ncbi:MAG: succinylglutamate desuccinylase/aspartoacylase family protein [Pseudomonadales bacterium]|nr:succinylglutamate desuccinylase/aspartoacylase family protein [Pseudomonadales bacterium]
MSDIREERIGLGAAGDAESASVRVLRFGTPGARPKAYLQAGLHAGELPGMLVLRELARRLAEAAARGALIGEVILVPMANPIGLAQRRFGVLQGRFEEVSGENFNRGWPDVTEAVVWRIDGSLVMDPASNVATIRSAISAEAAAIDAQRPVDRLRRGLFSLACDADLVLDLHADDEALVHLYTGPALWPRAEPLAAELDARAVLLCEASGGGPFDEACSAPWWALAPRFPGLPIPPACFAATVELRSNNEVEQRLVEDDAAALERFLRHEGVVAGEVRAAPRLLCEATQLTAMQQLRAPAEGVVIYRARLGDRVRRGEVVASLVDPLGDSVDVCAETEGVLFARHDQRYAWPGKVIGKIAGSEVLPERTGNLLTD